MKKNKFIIVILLGSFFFLTSCQTVQDGFGGKQKDNTDEFLVEKKNALVLPPDYNELPKPRKNQEKNNQNNNNEIKKLLGLIPEENNLDEESSANKSLEKSIIKVLNDN